MPEIVGVQCPFREGEEEAARQFLAQPLSVPDLRLPSRILRRPFVMWSVTALVPTHAIAYLVMAVFDGFEWSEFGNWMIFTVVLLPAPFRPMYPMICPGNTSRSTPFNTSFPL